MKVLIAGASGGIGKFLAEELSKQHEVLGTFNSQIPPAKSKISMTQVDISKETDVRAWISGSCSEDDELAMIYCIGVNYNCMMHKSDTEKWKQVIETNLIGVQVLLRNIIPMMRKKKFGRIVLLSSVVPQVGIPGTSAYAASKSALWGLCKAVAKENAEFGITINTINLGYFSIGMIKDVPDDILRSIVASIPMRTLGSPESILESINYLLQCSYITGSQINLNGGLY